MTAARLQRLLEAIDRQNRQDPNEDVSQGEAYPKEYLYGLRMSLRLAQFKDCPSELLQIACRAQHIKRWAIARSAYPQDRSGYKKWRTDLAKFHGELTASLMAEAGYSTAEQERVKDLLLKKHLKRDEEAQTLEDVACLVFLEFYLEDFARPHSREKLIVIIQKTWNKMSEQGHAAALKLPLPAELMELIAEALA